MVRPLKTLLSADSFLNSFECFRIKFDDFAALNTEHMVMVFMTECTFINCAALGLPDPVDEAAFIQEVHCPVDGCPGRLHPRLADLQVEGLRIKMTAPCQYLLNDDGTCFCKTLPSVLQKIYEDLFFCRFD